jgi:uroporphyrinogen decarboxylase
MTSRERVLKAVNFERPDRVPVDLGGIRASGINAAVYDALKKRMGISAPTKIHDTMQVLAEVEWEVLERIHADVVPLEAATARWSRRNPREGVEKTLFCGTTVFFPPGTDIVEDRAGGWLLRNAGGTPYAAMPKGGYYFDFIRPTMAHRTIDPTQFKPKDSIPDPELDVLSEQARFLYENTDKAILGWGQNISFFGLSALLSDNITQGSLDE